jgi:muconolactone delta-isomerase
VKGRIMLFRSLSIAFASAVLLTSPALAQTAPAAAATPQSVPTTKILAVGSLIGPRQPDRMKDIMPREVRDTVRLYLAGKIDQWYVKTDQSGVVFILNVPTVEEAHALLEALPLGEAHLMRFDLTPLGPLSPLRMLIQ